jgi:prefoldin subunit 5
MKIYLLIIAMSSILMAADSTDAISKRLVELQNEHKRGIELIQKLQNDLNQTQQSVLRIEGAIAVLEEIKTAKGEKK